MKTSILAILALLYSFAFAYSDSASNDVAELTSVSINPSTPASKILYQVSDKVKFVPLITKNGVFINGISKIIDHDTSFYLFCRNQPGIFCFDKKGNLRHYLVVSGKGPGELNSPLDICFFNNRLFVLESKRIKIFDPDFKFIGQVELPYFGRRIEQLDDNSLILYLNNFHKEYFHAKIGFNNDTIANCTLFKRKPSGLTNYTGFQFRNYQSWNGHCIFSSLWSDTIFSIKDTSLVPRWYIDFGKYKLPSNTYTTIAKDAYAASQYLESSGKAHRIENFVESDQYISFKYCFGNNLPRQVIIQKEGMKVLLNGYLTNEDNETLNLEVLGLLNNKIAISVDAIDLMFLKNNAINNKIGSSWSELVRYAERIDEDSNPVLILL